MVARRVIGVLAAAAALTFGGVARATPQEDEAAIRAQLSAWVSAFNSGDLEKAAQVWAPDPVGWPPEGPDDTYALERKFAATAVGKPTNASYALEINEVLLDCDMAIVRDTWTETPRAEPSKARIFRSFEVWRRQPDNAWRIARWIDGPFSPVKKAS